MLIDNLEKHFESCALNAQNAYKSAPNQINSLNTLKNELMKIFCGFQAFEYALWQETKPRKHWKSTESFLNQKNTQCLLFTITRKLLKSNQFVI